MPGSPKGSLASLGSDSLDPGVSEGLKEENELNNNRMSGGDPRGVNLQTLEVGQVSSVDNTPAHGPFRQCAACISATGPPPATCISRLACSTIEDGASRLQNVSDWRRSSDEWTCRARKNRDGGNLLGICGAFSPRLVDGGQKALSDTAKTPLEVPINTDPTLRVKEV